jgi:hypothetical protein
MRHFWRISSAIAPLVFPICPLMRQKWTVRYFGPGGVGGDAERRKLKTFFSTCCSTATWGMLTGIEQAFADWRGLPTLDAGDTIIRVFRLLGGYENTWIGTSVEDVPDQGKFVGDAFAEEDAISWHNEQASQHK